MSALTSLPYFHGTIDTRECREMLPELGDFLIRCGKGVLDKSTSGKAIPSICVLTVAVSPEQASTSAKLLPNDYTFKHQCTTRLRSYPINFDGKCYQLHGIPETFSSVQKLCERLIEKKKALPNGEVLKKPISRQPWELLLSDVQFPAQEILLGKGSYGKVVKAKLVKKDGTLIDVALKSLNDSAGNEEISDLFTEARSMRRLNHHNIIRLEGVIIEKHPVQLAIEFFEGTCLLKALQKKKVSNAMRFPVVCGIMYGLLFMHNNGYIHRDVAARNVMISADCRSVKLIDFGLAKHGLTFTLAATQKIPVKWLAPEVLKTWTFSTKSDVWAFGIAAWEVYHDGAEPYSNMKNYAVKGQLGKRKGKERTSTLKITANLRYLPKHFEYVLSRMMDPSIRNRTELLDMVIEVETKIIPKLPKQLSDECRMHMGDRPLPVTTSKLGTTSNLDTQVFASADSTKEEDDKPSEKKEDTKTSEDPRKPEDQKKMKTVTRRAARQPTTAQLPSSSPEDDKSEKKSDNKEDAKEKPKVKTMTARRKAK